VNEYENGMQFFCSLNVILLLTNYMMSEKLSITIFFKLSLGVVGWEDVVEWNFCLHFEKALDVFV